MPSLTDRTSDRKRIATRSQIIAVSAPASEAVAELSYLGGHYIMALGYVSARGRDAMMALTRDVATPDLTTDNLHHLDWHLEQVCECQKGDPLVPCDLKAWALVTSTCCLAAETFLACTECWASFALMGLAECSKCHAVGTRDELLRIVTVLS